MIKYLVERGKFIKSEKWDKLDKLNDDIAIELKND